MLLTYFTHHRPETPPSLHLTSYHSYPTPANRSHEFETLKDISMHKPRLNEWIQPRSYRSVDYVTLHAPCTLAGPSPIALSYDARAIVRPQMNSIHGPSGEDKPSPKVAAQRTSRSIFTAW